MLVSSWSALHLLVFLVPQSRPAVSEFHAPLKLIYRSLLWPFGDPPKLLGHRFAAQLIRCRLVHPSLPGVQATGARPSCLIARFFKFHARGGNRSCCDMPLHRTTAFQPLHQLIAFMMRARYSEYTSSFVCEFHHSTGFRRACCQPSANTCSLSSSPSVNDTICSINRTPLMKPTCMIPMGSEAHGARTEQ
ncbi:hypothetical protein C8J56DRAFT_270447 [Mycena floridula]|nr:hypothetical protein C8J56DRAFT_270447 [Mycena floridula]